MQFIQKDYKKIDPTNRMKARVIVKGYVYELTHPGTRRSSKWLQELISINAQGKATLDMVAVTEQCFQNVIEPLSFRGPMPDYDQISPDEADIWAMILPAFLRGHNVPDAFMATEDKLKAMGLIADDQASQKNGPGEL